MRMLKRLLAITGFAALVCGSVAAQGAQKLSLKDAEQIAIQNHPQIQAAADVASAAKAQVTEARSAYYPTVYGSLTAVDSENNSRITAGGLNNPIIYERYANGLTVSQLVTDFGRTHELVKSSNLHAQANQERVVATRADVLLGVDRAYFVALRAQAVLTVAQETVKDRQLVADQVGELEKNKIKSGLDLSFANVDLAQAQLLLLQAQNDLDTSYADLSAALGYGDQRTFELTDEPQPAAPPADFSSLLQQAIQNRPDLISLRLDAASAHSYATAERDLWFPTISAAGSGWTHSIRRRSTRTSLCSSGCERQYSDFQRAPVRSAALGSEFACERTGAVSARSAKPGRSRRSHRLAECEFRISAPRTYGSAPEASDRRDGSRPGSIQTGVEFHYRAQPIAVKYDPGPTRIRQRQIRLSDADLGLELSDRGVALVAVVGPVLGAVAVTTLVFGSPKFFMTPKLSM